MLSFIKHLLPDASLSALSIFSHKIRMRYKIDIFFIPIL